MSRTVKKDFFPIQGEQSKLQKKSFFIRWWRYIGEAVSGDPDTILLELRSITEDLEKNRYRSDEDIIIHLEYIAMNLELLVNSENLDTIAYELRLLGKRLLPFYKKPILSGIIRQLQNLEKRASLLSISNKHSSQTILKGNKKLENLSKCSTEIWANAYTKHPIEKSYELYKLEEEKKVNLIKEIKNIEASSSRCREDAEKGCALFGRMSVLSAKCKLLSFSNRSINESRVTTDNIQLIQSNFYLLLSHYGESVSNELMQILCIPEKLQRLVLCKKTSEEQKKAIAFKIQLILLDLQFFLLKKSSLCQGSEPQDQQLKNLISLCRKKTRKLKQQTIEEGDLGQIQHTLQSLIIENDSSSRRNDVILQLQKIYVDFEYRLILERSAKSIKYLKEIFKNESVYIELQLISNLIKSNNNKYSENTISELRIISDKLYTFFKKPPSIATIVSRLQSLTKKPPITVLSQQPHSAGNFFSFTLAFKNFSHIVARFSD